MALSFPMSLWILLGIFHATLRAHRSYFFLRSVNKFCSMWATLMRIRMLSYTLGWTLSFPIFLNGVMRLLRIARCVLVPRILRPSVKSSWTSLLYILEIRKPDFFEFVKKATNRTFTTSFLRLLIRLTVNLFGPEYALFTEFASRLCYVMLTHVRMPMVT